MSSGNDGVLTLTIKMKVSPEPGSQEKLLNLMQRYRDALNYSIRKIIENKTLSLSKAHKLLYNILKEKYNLPSRIAQDCCREALTIAKSWLRNENRGKVPKAKNLSIWLTYTYSYRVKGEYVEIIGGFRLRIIGWDKRYDSYPNREARLVFRDSKFILYISKRVPKAIKYSPKDILAIDINEKNIVVGNSKIEHRFETDIERALHYRQLAEKLQKKYSSTRYNGWTRRKNIRRRIKYLHKKARNIIEDWVKKISYKIAMISKQNQYAIAREDLTGLVENLRKLPKDHRVSLLMLSYRKLEFWIDWQAEKRGVPIIVIEPNGTSSICPKCGSKLKESGHRIMRCPSCGFEADRDIIAILNIEKKALSKIGGSLTTPTASQMTDVNPNKCGELMSRPGENLPLLGRGGGQNKEMWEEPGKIFIYNVHNNWMFNIVSHEEDKVGAVLIRALHPLSGIEEMMKNRKVKDMRELTNGPGKLTKAFKIDQSFNGKFLSPRNFLYIVERGIKVEFESSHRIGVKKDLKEKLRFYVVNDEFVSR